MRKSHLLLLRIEEKVIPRQELINDVYRVGRSILDLKEVIEKIAGSKKEPELKKAIAKLAELDVDIEYIAHQIEKIPDEKEK